MTPRAATVAEIPNVSVRSGSSVTLYRSRNGWSRYSFFLWRNRLSLVVSFPLVYPFTSPLLGKLPARLHAGAAVMIETSLVSVRRVSQTRSSVRARAINANEARNKTSLFERPAFSRWRRKLGALRLQIGETVFQPRRKSRRTFTSASRYSDEMGIVELFKSSLLGPG